MSKISLRLQEETVEQWLSWSKWFNVVVEP